MRESATSSSHVFREDHDLIRAFCGGDKHAFDDLVKKHQDKTFNLCCWFLGDYHEANDICQEIFIKVYQSLDRFRFESAFSTWLYRVAVNTCKNRVDSLEYRYKKWMGRLDAVKEPHDQDVLELADRSDSPLRELENKEQNRLIRKAINTLPNNKKTVVLLRDIEGLSYEEIGRVTGLKMGTIKSKLSRARLALRKKLIGLG